MLTFSVRVKVKVCAGESAHLSQRSRKSRPVLRFLLNEADGSLRFSGRMRFFELMDRL